jgi:hypothetical protein
VHRDYALVSVGSRHALDAMYIWLVEAAWPMNILGCLYVTVE